MLGAGVLVEAEPDEAAEGAGAPNENGNFGAEVVVVDGAGLGVPNKEVLGASLGDVAGALDGLPRPKENGAFCSG